ncbi:hypothetical protein HYW11_02970 [Candidatus Peregrinibacteria bacterium]|nr:hypothetical protein [Candidatus Peregrinibacteria bacterium]
MNLATALQYVSTLADSRKEELIARHLKGTLTTEDRAELKEHLLKALDVMEEEKATAKALIDALQQ